MHTRHVRHCFVEVHTVGKLEGLYSLYKTISVILRNCKACELKLCFLNIIGAEQRGEDASGCVRTRLCQICESQLLV
jgi:hypothetical protein